MWLQTQYLFLYMNVIFFSSVGYVTTCFFAPYIFRLTVREMSGQLAVMFKTVETVFYHDQCVMSSCILLSTNESCENREGKIAEGQVWEKYSKLSWMDKWVKDIHSVPEIDNFKEGGNKSGNKIARLHKMRSGCVNFKCLHCFIHNLSWSYCSVCFLLKKIWFMFPFIC